ncbi:MAG: tripartite tricarboxylate transporter TctB family protein [Burkholderiaceae bacterium]|nr:tripartite tricarboxylate transporter TctB family protein [Burkholderiaceae bacterium]
MSHIHARTPKEAVNQVLIGCGVLVLGGIMALGAFMIPSEAGYSGVGPNFLPGLVAAVLLISGAWVIWEARTGGFRNMDVAPGADTGFWSGFAWMSAGLLANAALITTIGFILSCTLCFAFAVRGLRTAEADKVDGFDVRQFIKDLCIGVAIAAPVYWMFTKLLAINLPGLTTTGWI